MKHATVHHRWNCARRVLDFPTNIDILSRLIFISRAIPTYVYVCEILSYVRTHTSRTHKLYVRFIILIYYSVYFPRRTCKCGVTRGCKRSAREGLTHRVVARWYTSDYPSPSAISARRHFYRKSGAARSARPAGRDRKIRYRLSN